MYRLILGIGFIVLLSLMWIGGRGKPVTRVIHEDKTIRKALRVHMIEKRQGNDSGFIVNAAKLLEVSKDAFIFYNMDIRTENGIYMKCKYAEYDASHSRLNVPGKIILELPKDNARALINGIVWDRNSGKATTEKPVEVRGKGILIKAKKAVFSNNFQRLNFFGGVYAKVSINYVSL